MDDNGFDWGTFLRRWQDEWVPSEDEAMELEEGETTLADLALAAPPASEGEVADAERRLGTRLPPSYRGFLLASNGWALRDDSIYQLGAAHEIGWFGDPFSMTPMYRESLDERATEQQVLLAGMWERALQLETDSDMSYALLDPGDTDEDGEWALYVYKGWSGEYPTRYPSFRAYMQRRYESFHAERAQLPEFVNDTTRARDADVARAREEALSGRWEAARELLAVARRYGRPGAWGMLGQLDVLDRASGTVARPSGGSSPIRAARTSWCPCWPWPGRGTAAPTSAPTASRWASRPTTASRRPPTRYSPGCATVPTATHRTVTSGGPSPRRGRPRGQQAERRQQARCGRRRPRSRVTTGPRTGPRGQRGTDHPPRAVRVTPQELLATPRAGRTGTAPERVPDLDPPGLSWLAESQRWNAPFGSYRCLWVEGVEPEALPGLVGQDADAGLTAPPVRPAGWFPHDVRQRRDGEEPWEDRAVVAVGRTGSGWAFGFDPAARTRGPGRLFVSPAAEASRGGRAVVLWVCRGRDDMPRVFHLSVAERGEELYAYTLRGTDVERSGEVPAALDPERVLSGVGDADRERRLLAAVEGEFGLSLPRHALAEGILPELTTRSWNRAPREGEVFAYATVTVSPR
ncbi:SMI1/KNR4 family protein [Streptomyces albogriseolus]|uniref:SMI1/KNR4 family protein n=1 Tax=Streptomyces albogriseolus TaxID=1887 RepID=UPI00345F698B